MSWRLAEAFALLALALGCGADGPASPQEASLDGPFELAPGSVARIGEDLEVGFDAVANDSRCPTGATCVWEGDAVVRVWLRKGAEPRLDLRLHTNGSAGPGEASYLGYQVRLVGVAPHPRLGRTIKPSDYRATLVVSRKP